MLVHVGLSSVDGTFYTMDEIRRFIRLKAEYFDTNNPDQLELEGVDIPIEPCTLSDYLNVGATEESFELIQDYYG